MRTTFKALTAVAGACAATVLSAGTAFAADAPVLPAPGTTITVSSSTLANIVDSALGNGCTTTYVNQITTTEQWSYVTVNGLIITVNGDRVAAYTLGVAGSTLAYITCAV